MNSQEATEYIKDNPQIYFKPANKSGWVCPLCQSGSGSNGTGITENPKSKRHFKCFNCGENGDVLHFIGKEYGLNSFPDILKKAYSIYGIILDDEKSTRKRKEQNKMQNPTEKQTSCAEEDFQNFYKKANENLKETEYLTNRGISVKTQNLFNIGYVKNWVSPTAERAGKKPKPSSRIIIPTSNSSYVARDTSDAKDYKIIKEGNSHLFNSKAFNIDNGEVIFITEGEIDALSIIEAGGEAIGLGGVSNVNLFITELEKKREAARQRAFVICLDNDDAGKKASAELQKKLKTKDFVVTDECQDLLPECKDPNEALLKNKDAFIAAVKDIKLRVLKMLEEDRENYIQEYSDKLSSVLDSYFIEKKTIKTGLTELDNFLDGGLHAGLYVLGAASGAGKTTFALQIADNMAKEKQDVLFFSGEMAINEIVAKSLSRLSKETSNDDKKDALTMRTVLNIAGGNNDNNYKDRLSYLITENYRDISQYIRIYDGLQKIDDIKNKIEKHKTKTGNNPVIFIDYLQIIKPDTKNSKTEKRLQVDEIVSELRIAAVTYKTPIFVISSLKRASYTSDGTKPQTDYSDEKEIYMGDLKESGGIEYGADIIITLNTDKSSNENKDGVRKVKARIIKNRTGKRHGKGEAINFKFHTMFNYFSDDKATNGAVGTGKEKEQNPKAENKNNGRKKGKREIEHEELMKKWKKDFN